ncbi:MAG: metallophosphoesterase, partial [Deinococcota bacterium]
MRIALLSDIHGNSIALNAVLQDIAAQGGVDGYWILGDLVAIGPDPIGVMEQLTALPHAVFTRGNTDRYTVTGERPSPFETDVKQDLDLLPLYKEVNNCFAWTQGAITAAGYFEWLSNLELEHRHTLPNGIRCLGVHASPGRDDGSGVHPKSTQQELQTLVGGCGADIVFVGHTHASCDITVEDIRIVNLGSISNPI